MGARFDDDRTGSAYIFGREKGGANNWGEFKKLAASDVGFSSWFGHSVAISGDVAIVSAALDDADKGSAFLFRRDHDGANNWGETKKLLASDGAEKDRFGWSVGISEGVAIVGAYGMYGMGRTGSAYLYLLNQPPVAKSGEDQTVEATSPAGAEVTLDGSGSSDPDDDALTYTWRENGNVIAGPTTASQSNVTLSLGEHLIELTVEDAKGGSDTDEVTITVEDTTPPEVTAEFIPVDVEEDEGTFAIQCCAADVCDPNPSLSAVIEIPTLIDPEIKFKEKNHKKLKIDLKKNKVKVEGPDPQEFWAEVQNAGGIPVCNGQEMEIEIKDKQKYEYKFDDEGNLDKIKAPEVTLLCTATDASGNVGTATANPTFEPEDDDDDDENDNGLEKIAASNLAESSVVEDYSLYQNYPNPFNPETSINYQLPEKVWVKIAIFNLRGQQILSLENELQEAGYHTVHWDGCDEIGNKVVSGIYLYRIQVGDFVSTKKMTLMN